MRLSDNYAHDVASFSDFPGRPADDELGEHLDGDEIVPDEMLQAIWGTGWHSLCAARGKTDFHTVGVYNDTRELLDEAAAVNAAGANVWFGVHPMTAKPPAGRGGNDDVSEVRVLVADLDWKADDAHEENDKLPTEAEVRAALERFPHQPTFV
nr:hypothetical protein [Actinomycetota bacterium]